MQVSPVGVNISIHSALTPILAGRLVGLVVDGGCGNQMCFNSFRNELLSIFDSEFFSSFKCFISVVPKSYKMSQQSHDSRISCACLSTKCTLGIYQDAKYRQKRPKEIEHNY